MVSSDDARSLIPRAPTAAIMPAVLQPRTQQKSKLAPLSVTINDLAPHIGQVVRWPCPAGPAR